MAEGQIADEVHRLVEKMYDAIENPRYGPDQIRREFRELTDDLATITAVSALPYPDDLVISFRDKGLTNQEALVLAALKRNNGRPVQKYALLDTIVLKDTVPQSKLLDVLVCRIRKVLPKINPDWRIETVWGIGYRLLVNGEPEAIKPLSTVRKLQNLAKCA